MLGFSVCICFGVSYGLIEAIQFNGEGKLWDVWWVGHHLPSKETDDNLDAIEYSTLMQAKKIHKKINRAGFPSKALVCADFTTLSHPRPVSSLGRIALNQSLTLLFILTKSS